MHHHKKTGYTMKARTPVILTPAVNHLPSLLICGLLATALTSGAFGAQNLTSPVTIENDQVLIQAQDQGEPALRYVFQEGSPKAYVKELRTPSGINILRDSPEDHVHHHALMFALGAGEDIDFWGETEGCGIQVQKPIDNTFHVTSGKTSLNGFQSTLDWMAPGREAPLIVENRSIALREPQPGAPTIATWTSTLQPGPGLEQTQLWGRHYFGLGLRFDESMDEAGKHFNGAGITGENVRGDEFVVPVPWSAYAAELHGKPVTVAVFDHPDNPRHPAGIFIMSTPFAYQAATLNLWKEPIQLSTDHPLTVTYGVAVWDGHPGPEVIEKTYQDWIEFH
jgi:hypothetical protein